MGQHQALVLAVQDHVPGIFHSQHAPDMPHDLPHTQPVRGQDFAVQHDHRFIGRVAAEAVAAGQSGIAHAPVAVEPGQDAVTDGLEFLAVVAGDANGRVAHAPAAAALHVGVAEAVDPDEHAAQFLGQHDEGVAVQFRVGRIEEFILEFQVDPGATA